MKKILFLLLVLLVAHVSTSAQQSVPEGFTSLFNGKDFSGWDIQPDSGAWYVADKMICCKGKPSVPYLILTEKAYENFELYVDFKTATNCNSGVFLHQTFRNWGRESRNGMEIQITSHAGRLPVNNSCGAIYEQSTPLANPVKPAGLWNTYYMIMDWPILKVWMNGVLIQDVNLENNPNLKYRLRNGFIGLQNHATDIAFKNIYIKELPSKEDQWTLLFDGKDLRNWTPVGEAIWKIENGVLVASGGDGYLVSNEEYEKYHFQMFAKKERKEGNSGVYYDWKNMEQKGYKADLPSIDHYKYPLFQIINEGKKSFVIYNGDYVQKNLIQTTSSKGRIAIYHAKEDGKINISQIRIR